MKALRINKVKMVMGVPSDGMVPEGTATPQEVLLEILRNNLDEFREAQRRIDSQRKSR